MAGTTTAGGAAPCHAPLEGLVPKPLEGLRAAGAPDPHALPEGLRHAHAPPEELAPKPHALPEPLTRAAAGGSTPYQSLDPHA